MALLEEFELLQKEKESKSCFEKGGLLFKKKATSGRLHIIEKTNDYLANEAFRASMSTFLITGLAHNCLILITRAV
jgi:hypothetical protein